MSKTAWTKDNVPDQSGKLVIITGGTGGLGFENALVLAEKGATVIVAGRNDAKGKDAIAKIVSAIPNAKVSFGKVDLTSLASIKDFCDRFDNQHKALDLLINNAGIMALPKRKTTVDGFEMQIGVNHLSHFALTARLLPALRRSKIRRVVNVASVVHKQGKMNFKDLQYEKGYNHMIVYNQSKLANLLFSLELQRRSDEGGWGLLVTTSHPGISKTNLFTNGFGGTWFYTLFNAAVMPFFSHSAYDGALCTIYAATSPEVQPNGYYGPNGFCDFTGSPGPAYKAPRARDKEAAKKLWDVSTTLTKVSWP